MSKNNMIVVDVRVANRLASRSATRVICVKSTAQYVKRLGASEKNVEKCRCV